MKRPLVALFLAALGAADHRWAGRRTTAAGASAADAGGRAATTPWEPEPIEWSPSPDWDGAEEGWLEVPIDYANPDGGTIRLYLTRHRAAGPVRRASASLLVNPGGPGARGLDPRPRRAADLQRSAGRALRHRRRGTRAAPASRRRSSTASTTTTGTTPAATSRPTTTPSASSSSTLAEDLAAQCVAKNAAILPVRRHQQLGPRHGLHPSGARRGRDQLLRVELRLRARRHVGHAVPRHGAGRRARRRLRPQRRPARNAACSRSPGSRARSTTYLAQCSADPACSFHNDGDAEAAFDELMLKLDDKPIPSDPGRPDDQPLRWRSRRWPRRCTARAGGPSCPTPSPPPRRATGRAARAVGLVLRAAVRRHLVQPRRGVRDDLLHGQGRPADGRGGRRDGAAAQRGRPAHGSRDDRRLHVHVLPAVHRPARRDHRRRRRPDRRVRRHRRRGHAARQHAQHGRRPSRTVGWSSSTTTDTRATGTTRAPPRSSTTTSSTSWCHPRRRSVLAWRIWRAADRLSS